MLQHLLLTPLFDEYTDYGGGGPDDQGPTPDFSSGYTDDGSYWYQGDDGSTAFVDGTTGETYTSDAEGNYYDSYGRPVTDSGLLQKFMNAAKNALGGSGNGGPGGAAAAGKALGSAASAAGNNRLTQEELALQQERINLEGTNQFEAQLMKRASEEQALKNSMFENLGSANTLDLTANRAMNPRVSPFDPTGGPKYSPETLAALKANAARGQTAATTPNQYGASSWSPMTPYKPIDLTQVQQATGTKPGTLEQIGNTGAGTIPWLDFFLKGAPKPIQKGAGNVPTGTYPGQE